MFDTFTISDWLQFWGILASLFTSVVAISISVVTLKQNSKMIEESTRPYIAICGKTTNCQSTNFYLVLKNYGNSGATITKFFCDHDLSFFSYDEKIAPFANILGTSIAPNQSFVTNLNTEKLFKEMITLNFNIEYKTGNKTYTDTFSINLKSYTDIIQTRASTKDKELKIISYALQDLVEKHL